jgi:predicted nuclease of predicted toxin-antitoxin system
VVDRAASESRILITFDKDFGELAFRRGLYSQAGIILFRIKAPSPAHVARVAVAVLESRADWAGHFSVIEEGQVRMTPLPGSK